MRILFCVLLLASATGKLLDMPGFYTIVASYDAIPTAWIPALAWLLALTELALAMWLASGLKLRRAAGAVVGLHAVYLAWIATALYRGLPIANCGCFGVYWARPLSALTLLEDAVLLALACHLLRGAARASRGLSGGQDVIRNNAEPPVRLDPLSR